jgi:hypothetical protein
MTYSNYPNGFPEGVLIAGVPLQQAYPGKVFWVNSSTALPQGGKGGSNGNKGTYLQPFATIDYAIGQCTAGRGDVIMVMPGHTETVTTAGGIALDVAGVAVIGLGTGTLRPTISLTATAASVTMSAANCVIQNVLFTGDIDAVTRAVLISASDCVLQNCEIRDVTGQVTDGVVVFAQGDRTKILDHIHSGATAAGTNAGIALVGPDDVEITIKRMDGNFAVGGIDIRTTAVANLHVHNVLYFRTRNAADIFAVDTITGSTGQFGPNIFMRLNDNAANITEAITGATFVVMDFGVHVVNAPNEKSIAINWTASTDA